MLERIKRHWVWPHLVTLFVICVLIDLVALGFGIVWTIRYLSGLVGGWTLFWIFSVLALYLIIWRIARRRQQSDLGVNYADSSVIDIPARNGMEPLRLGERPYRNGSENGHVGD